MIWFFSVDTPYWVQLYCSPWLWLSPFSPSLESLPQVRWAGGEFCSLPPVYHRTDLWYHADPRHHGALSQWPAASRCADTEQAAPFCCRLSPYFVPQQQPGIMVPAVWTSHITKCGFYFESWRYATVFIFSHSYPGAAKHLFFILHFSFSFSGLESFSFNYYSFILSFCL